MKREEVFRIGASFYGQTAAWFLVTALLVFAVRGVPAIIPGDDGYATLVAIITFGLSTLLVLALGKARSFMRIYAGLVYFALLYGTYFILSLLWPREAALACVSLAACLLFFSPRVVSQNLVLAIALAGIAAQFVGTMSFAAALVLVMVLSLYDILAVNVTHHMVTMAKHVIQRHLPVVFVMPWKASDLGAHVERFEAGSSAVFLGAGDIALPAVLVATAPTTFMAVTVIIGTLIGFLALNIAFFSGSKPHPLPALPFLFLSIATMLVLAVFV